MKEPKTFAALPPGKPTRAPTPNPKMQLRSLWNRLLPYKTQSSSLKPTLVKVLGKIPDNSRKIKV